MKPKRSPSLESPARLRILKTARDLFYRNGYRATGINEVIRKSGVAKATFYAHFPSKEKLAYAYVQDMNDEDTRMWEQGLAAYPGPYEKLTQLADILIGYLEPRDFRGCGYLIIASEILDPTNPVRRESQAHYDAIRRIIGRLTHELKEDRGPDWKDRDAEKIADDLLLIVSGALALAQVYHSAVPLHAADKAIRRLLD